MNNSDIHHCILDFLNIANLFRWLRVSHIWNQRIINILYHKKQITVNESTQNSDKRNLLKPVIKYCKNINCLNLITSTSTRVRIAPVLVSFTQLQCVFLSNNLSMNNNYFSQVDDSIIAVLKYLPTTLRILSIMSEFHSHKPMSLINNLFGSSLKGLEIYPSEFDRIGDLIKACSNLIVVSIYSIFTDVNELAGLHNCRYLSLKNTNAINLNNIGLFNKLREFHVKFKRIKHTIIILLMNNFNNLIRLTIHQPDITNIYVPCQIICNLIHKPQSLSYLEKISINIANEHITNFISDLAKYRPNITFYREINLDPFKSQCARAGLF